MTRFADDLFNDLMREHGPALAQLSVPAARQRRHLTRPVLMTAGATGLAAAATVGTLVATGGGSPAYAVTTHPNGTVTLAVYQESGIAGANAQLHQLGDDRVVVVPVGSGCPSINSLRAPAVPASQISVQASSSSDGSVTVDAHGIPAGDILVLGWATTGRGQFSMSQSMTSGSAEAHGKASGGSDQPPTAADATTEGRLTSGPAPSCVSVPPLPQRGGRLVGPGAGGSSGGQGTYQSGGGPGGKSVSGSN